MATISLSFPHFSLYKTETECSHLFSVFQENNPYDYGNQITASLAEQLTGLSV